MTPAEIQDLVRYLTPDEKAELERLLQVPMPLWIPQDGPQRVAYESTADVIGYGGAAGGGKTDLALGKALTQHQVVAFFRKEGTELTGAIDRLGEILGHRTGLGGKPPIWRAPGGTCRLVEFCSIPNPGDERKYQGRAKDLLVLDEAANMLESQVRFLMGWVRSVDPLQRTQTLMCFNPPTTVEGRWIVQYFAPWLDRKHPNPAQPGELRWFAMIRGVETEVSDGRQFHDKGELIIPQSRTFIPAKVSDNAFLKGTNYMAQLQALPEPLRSQMLYGDFNAGTEDDPQQVIPTGWVEAAMARWKKLDAKPPMSSMGLDVARGGKDNTVISTRHGMWFDELTVYPGTDTPDGETTAALAMAKLRNHAPIHIDVIGVGASPFDVLRGLRQQVIGVNVSNSPTALDKSGLLQFSNMRTQLWWKLREALDPLANNGIALPPDKRLLLDLCTPKWKVVGRTIQVQSREEIIDKIGRSPDYASAVCLALIETPNQMSTEQRFAERALPSEGPDYNPLDFIRQRG